MFARLYSNGIVVYITFYCFYNSSEYVKTLLNKIVIRLKTAEITTLKPVKQKRQSQKAVY